jgi:Dyp-type peroxidase family
MATEPAINVENIQGNIIPGFKKDHQHFLFYTIKDADAARTWLGSLHERLSSSKEVFEAHDLWKTMRKRLGREPDNVQFIFLNVALSATGLKKIKPETEVAEFGDDGFLAGMKKRSEYLGDPSEKEEPGNAENWIVGGPKTVDVLLILASDDLPWLLEVEAGLEKEAAENGLKTVHKDRGKVMADDMAGHEHFGFKDGVSDPAVRGIFPDSDKFIYPRTLPPGKPFNDLRKRFAAPGKPLVWPGHFIFGYGKQKDDDPETYLPDVKVKGPDWAADGSFLVYRRLRQDVKAFEKFVRKTSDKIAAKHPELEMNPERLGALLVGRWKSGTPVMCSPLKDLMIHGDGENYFQFSEALSVALPGGKGPVHEADNSGFICPLGSHIRKVNPRDETTDIGVKEKTFSKLLLRRGITFDNTAAENGGLKDKGLIFVAYQSSIKDQFEFLTRTWINMDQRPRDNAGHDPILVQGKDKYFNLITDKNSEEPERIPLPGGWVVPTGGEYFFAPSISFFKSLNPVT